MLMDDLSLHFDWLIKSLYWPTDRCWLLCGLPDKAALFSAVGASPAKEGGEANGVSARHRQAPSTLLAD